VKDGGSWGLVRREDLTYPTSSGGIPTENYEYQISDNPMAPTLRHKVFVSPYTVQPPKGKAKASAWSGARSQGPGAGAAMIGAGDPPPQLAHPYLLNEDFSYLNPQQ
jgi:hypothetical protein